MVTGEPLQRCHLGNPAPRSVCMCMCVPGARDPRTADQRHPSCQEGTRLSWSPRAHQLRPQQHQEARAHGSLPQVMPLWSAHRGPETGAPPAQGKLGGGTGWASMCTEGSSAQTCAAWAMGMQLGPEWALEHTSPVLGPPDRGPLANQGQGRQDVCSLSQDRLV